MNEPQSCPECNGTGKQPLISAPCCGTCYTQCKVCNGWGVVWLKKSVENFKVRETVKIE